MAEVVMIKRDVGFYVARIKDFDPATDEVIAVKKNAARVWVEGYTNQEVLHGKQPYWDDSNWYSGLFGYVTGCVGGNKMAGVKLDDCVEFVAVKTHRPPVEHKAKLPEPVAELSDEAKVKAVYPKAYHAVSGNIWEEDSATARQLSLQFARADLAWADAARRLNTETKPVDHHNFGCGVEVVSGAVLAN